MPAAGLASPCRPCPTGWCSPSRTRSRAGVIHPTNPIDLGDIFDFTVYTDIMAAVCRDPEVDAVLFHYGPMADFELESGPGDGPAHAGVGPGSPKTPGDHRALHPG